MTQESKTVLREKIVKGLELTRKRLIADKIQKGHSIVISKDGEITKVNPRGLK